MLDSRSKSHATERGRYLTRHCPATFVIEEDEYEEQNEKTRRIYSSSNMNKTSNRLLSWRGVVAQFATVCGSPPHDVIWRPQATMLSQHARAGHEIWGWNIKIKYNKT